MFSTQNIYKQNKHNFHTIFFFKLFILFFNFWKEIAFSEEYKSRNFLSFSEIGRHREQRNNFVKVHFLVLRYFFCWKFGRVHGTEEQFCFMLLFFGKSHWRTQGTEEQFLILLNISAIFKEDKEQRNNFEKTKDCSSVPCVLPKLWKIY